MGGPPIILGAAKSVGPVLALLGGMIVIVIVAGLVLLFIRARILSRSADTGAEEGLLAGLRGMRDRGEITAREYDAARKNLAERAAGRAGPRPPPAGERRAKPGVDLTGAPLPTPDRPSRADE